MKKERIENILNELLSTGGDFGELFFESTSDKSFNFVDNKLDSLSINSIEGVGIRLAKKDQVYYASTDDLSDESLMYIIDTLKKNIDDKVIYNNIKLEKLKQYHNKINNKYTDNDIKKLLNNINDKIRIKDERIIQVNIKFVSEEQKVTIANHTGLYVSENRNRSRLFIIVNFKDNENVANISYSYGTSGGNVMLDEINFDDVIDDLIKKGLDKLYAKPCVGKVMPVIIGPGFGGVIFHEACGHAMEATSVADKLSVLSFDLNKKIASEKVTIIDDGTIDSSWGSTLIDDEGHITQKNILIKDGVLVNYLIDEINNRKMKMQTTGSGRRESYLFAPTSRMNNTYLACGTDKVEDMIKSIDLGLYAVKMGGGSVSTETGDFNFACDLAYMIRDGKIAECVKSASLIGNTKEILKEVEMVSDDLSLGQGVCGSVSGSVPVNVGQPTIKIGHILVGGTDEE